jgi:serine/threonine protein kinase
VSRPDDAPPASPPQVVLRRVAPGRYRDFLAVGAGGMGIVYRAFDVELSRDVAFKVMRPDPGVGRTGITPAAPLAIRREATTPGDFAGARARFLEEAWLTAGMEHAGIASVHEIGETEGGLPYYTMRFVRGNRTLGDALDETAGKPLDARLALLDPFLKLCDAVHYAHDRGVVHRDLKPANVAIGEFGEVVVLDWGVAAVVGEDRGAHEAWRRRIHDHREASALATSHAALGTPGHMPPESLAGDRAPDPRGDVFALGSILFEVLTGRLPWPCRTLDDYASAVEAGDAPRADAVARVDAGDAVPAGLADVCERALARDPARRPADAGALARAVRAWHASSVADREVAAAVAEADALLASAASLSGDALLAAMDRAALACARALERRPGDARAEAAQRRVAEQRARAVAERERAARRRTRRRAGAIALSVAAVAAVVVAGVLDARRREAEDARRRSDREHQNAESLVDFMVFDLKDGLDSIGRVDLLAHVARQAKQHYDRTPLVEASPEDVRRRVATWQVLGDVFRSQGDLPSALDAYRSAVALAEPLAAAAPGDVARAFQASVSRARAAEVRNDQGYRSEAKAVFRAHLDELERLTRLAPDDLDLAAEHARAHGVMGIALFRTADVAGALADLRESVALHGALVERSRGEARREDAWLDARTRLANIAGRDDPRAGLDEHRAVRARASALLERSPGDHRWRRRAVESRAAMIVPLAKSGDLAAARAAYDEARWSLEHMRASDPTDERWAEQLVILRVGMADVLNDARDFRSAEAVAREGLAIAEPLSARDPTNARRINLIVDLTDRAARALAGVKSPEAYLMRRRNVAASERLIERDPENVVWRMILGFNTRRLADDLAGIGEHVGALASYEKALSVLARLAEEFPDDWRVREALAVCRRGRGRMRYLTGDRALGLAQMLEGAADSREAMARFADSLDIASTHVEGLRWLGRTVDLSDPAARRAARAAYAEAAEVVASGRLGDPAGADLVAFAARIAEEAVRVPRDDSAPPR